MKKLKKIYESSPEIIIVLIILSIISFLFLIAHYPYITENDCKNYIIEHQDDMIKYKTNRYKIDTCEFNYYTDITIRISDSSYNVIFWGDRKSWKWGHKLDKYFEIDIPYNRYKGKNIDIDVEIIKILTE